MESWNQSRKINWLWFWLKRPRFTENSKRKRQNQRPANNFSFFCYCSCSWAIAFEHHLRGSFFPFSSSLLEYFNPCDTLGQWFRHAFTYSSVEHYVVSFNDDLIFVPRVTARTPIVKISNISNRNGLKTSWP